jgi:hypothetical protein
MVGAVGAAEEMTMTIEQMGHITGALMRRPSHLSIIRSADSANRGEGDADTVEARWLTGNRAPVLDLGHWP